MFRPQVLVALLSLAVSSLFHVAHAYGGTLVITNDDGWATAQIRAQFEALSDAGYNVILSAPAQNQSGKGSQTTTPVELAEPCQFDTCPAGSPAFGYDPSDPRLNYVNAYPVDAANYGIDVLSPAWFGDAPDFVVSGPNIGDAPDFVVSGPNIGANIGIFTQLSGTVGAASAASLQGIPAAAFSGVSGASVSYTTLTSEPDANSTLAARTYSALTARFVDALLGAPGGATLPPQVIVNVNYAAIDACPSADDYRWVFTRNRRDAGAVDVETCGSVHLPSEAAVVLGEGCYASVSAISAVTKTDVDAVTQAAVLERLQSLPFSCYQ